MIVSQKSISYQPITIELSKQRDAVAFFGLIDKVEAFRCNDCENFDLSSDEIRLVVEFSNLNSESKICF